MAGDRPAFASLWERFASVAHAVLLGMVPWDEAPDLLQDVSLSALRAIGTLKDPAAFAPWLCRIARNRARDAWRHRRRVDELHDNLPAPAPEPGDERADAVLEEIRALPDAYRLPLILRLVEGMTGPEIAVRTGMTPGSVRVNLCRGMKLLRTALGGEMRP